jgi:hypothetical protein
MFWWPVNNTSPLGTSNKWGHYIEMRFEVKDVAALRKTERQLVAGLECRAELEQGLTSAGTCTVPEA